VVSTPLEKLPKDLDVLAVASAPPKQPNEDFDFDFDFDSALGIKESSLPADYQKVMNKDEARPSALPQMDHALDCPRICSG
jgi:hypothetical protein